MYDKTNHESFLNIENWLRQVNDLCLDHTVKYLVGNKADRADAISTEVGQCKAEQLKVGYIETSAKNGTGINEAFFFVAQELVKITDNGDITGRGSI